LDWFFWLVWLNDLMTRMIGAIFMKLGRAPATSIIFMKESLWIGIELPWATGNKPRFTGLELSQFH
jgi:hypothetical protein